MEVHFAQEGEFTINLNALRCADVWCIEFVTQLAQSPDLYILKNWLLQPLKMAADVTLFRAKYMNQMLHKIKLFLHSISGDTLNLICNSLIQTCNAVLGVKGDHLYDLPITGNRKRPFWVHFSMVETISVLTYNSAKSFIDTFQRS